jgi:glutathione S-transferase
MPSLNRGEPMHTLYYSPGAASLVIHWLLIELDLPYELKLLDFESKQQKSPDYLKLNPSGVVPTLVIDGEALTESVALLMHLADSHPSKGFAPPVGSLERARYYQWLLYLANMVQPLFRNWYYPAEAAGEANVEVVKDSARRRIEACWQNLDDHLAKNGPWLLGDKLSAADFHLTMLMRWSRNLPKQAIEWPNLARMATAMKARPSFKRLYAEEQLSEWA